jgi:hypothetical protein
MATTDGCMLSQTCASAAGEELPSWEQLTISEHIAAMVQALALRGATPQSSKVAACLACNPHVDPAAFMTTVLNLPVARPHPKLVPFEP